ncbi:host cell division inhibitor Icd-like protein [Proteus mirabilis]|uniref:host cell division inhibitor Icd-like protein n=1 Tax=Proteus mirabilis TaxID=584 RepID=UPI001A2BAC0F|nr:host cell division inhibitor Icd-like protein [Proteus mirabilis]MBI6255765.1 host cell division inhibitor Icd-like protein [Proteus mirabilis]MBS3856848.1 host cell division inhibitor Icd-like protein [Proteus mirabilis]MDF7328301.1 host cell division inhibitor Icd-like protein [Proteus mirabilis]
MRIISSINKQPVYKWLFFALERINRNGQPRKVIVFANSYNEAKNIIAKKYIYSFAGKVPLN